MQKKHDTDTPNMSSMLPDVTDDHPIYQLKCKTTPPISVMRE